jgi:uncharacterized protein (TIGR03067 family)
MHRLSLPLAALFIVPLLGSDSPKEYDDRTEPVGIEGTWQRTAFELRGEPLDLPYQSVVTFHNGTYTRNDSNGDTLQGTYRIVSSDKPGHVDFMPSNGILKGQTLKFIYQVDGDTFRDAGIPSEEYRRRPQGFRDKDVEVGTYKRVK